MAAKDRKDSKWSVVSGQCGVVRDSARGLEKPSPQANAPREALILYPAIGYRRCPQGQERPSEAVEACRVAEATICQRVVACPRFPCPRFPVGSWELLTKINIVAAISQKIAIFLRHLGPWQEPKQRLSRAVKCKQTVCQAFWTLNCTRPSAGPPLLSY
jgi:hypothetical protein